MAIYPLFHLGKGNTRMTKIIKIEISTDDLQSILKGVDADFKEYGLIDLSGDERIDVLCSAMNEKMASLLKSEADFWVEDDILHWQSDSYHRVDFWTQLVWESYEGQLDDTELWNDFFGFGGDDDVDYNGSYIDGVNEFLSFCMKRELLNDYIV